MRNRTVKDSPLRVYYGQPAAPSTVVGYAQVTNAVTADPSLSPEAKVMYAAIVSRCRDADVTYASVDDLAAGCGLKRRRAQNAIADLAKAGIIDRRQDWSTPLCPWMTTIKVDRKGGAKPPVNVDTGVRTPLRTPAHDRAHPRARSCAPRPYSGLRQTLLDFNTTTTTTSSSLDAELSEPIKRAIELFPDVEPEPARARAISSELLEATIDLAMRLRHRYPDPRHGQHPRSFRWVEVTAANWSGRPIEAFLRQNETVGPLPPAPAAPIAAAAADPPQDVVPPEGFRAAFLAGLEAARAADTPEIEAGRGCSAKNPPRPAGTGQFRFLTSVHDGQEAAKVLSAPARDEKARHCARQESNLQPSDSKCVGLSMHLSSGKNPPPSRENSAVLLPESSSSCKKPSDLVSEGLMTPIPLTGVGAGNLKPEGGV
jgi:Helix-turn-helix domain